MRGVPPVSVAAYNDSPTAFSTMGQIETRASFPSHPSELSGNDQNDAQSD